MSELSIFAALLNAAVSLGLIAYLLRCEHRFTKLETEMKSVLVQLNLMKE